MLLLHVVHILPYLILLFCTQPALKASEMVSIVEHLAATVGTIQLKVMDANIITNPGMFRSLGLRAKAQNIGRSWLLYSDILVIV